MKRRAASAAVIVALACSVAPSVLGAASREELRAIITDVAHRPATIVDGVGSPHHPVTTRSDGAQAFYDQGLGWMHSYFWMESARSFHHALTLDADLALAHVGLYVVYWNLGMRDLSKRHLDAAAAQRDDVSERERMYIDARVIQHECDHLDGILYPMRIEDLSQFCYVDELSKSPEKSDIDTDEDEVSDAAADD